MVTQLSPDPEVHSLPMTTGLRHVHSYLAYAVLAALPIAERFAVWQLMNKRSVCASLRRTAPVAFILSHLQLLCATLLYLVSPVALPGFSGGAVQDSMASLDVLDHPLTM